MFEILFKVIHIELNHLQVELSSPRFVVLVQNRFKPGTRRDEGKMTESSTNCVAHFY